jgi:hypothetical protein
MRNITEGEIKMKKKNTERRVYTKEFMAKAVALAEKREKPIKAEINVSAGHFDIAR